MVNFNKERQIVILYTCATCNLNCRYCTIDKNPALLDIDKELEESFKGDYYFNRIKEYFPRLDQLRSVETWGGEPFLHIERAFPLFHQLIDYYPFLEEFHASTNFSYDEWINKFMGLMNCFKDYPYRKFKYFLQLSVDGPEDINDHNRGDGVTKRCINNFDKLINIIKAGQFPSNVTLVMTIKGTWDLDAIHALNSKEAIIKFFQFYEDNFINKIKELNNENILMHCTVPNMAVPSPVTKHDGELFAELVKNCREIERENIAYHYFKHYQWITPFSGLTCNECRKLTGDVAKCGSGRQMVGFLPHNMISACHEGFTLLVDKYKEYASKRSEENLAVTLNKFFELSPTPMCLTDDEYAIHEKRMAYLNHDSPVQFSNISTMIIALAMAGLIEPQYLNEENAIFAAKQVAINGCFCIKVNYAVTGSFCTEPIGLYILLLNGALKYLISGGSPRERDGNNGFN